MVAASIAVIIINDRKKVKFYNRYQVMISKWNNNKSLLMPLPGGLKPGFLVGKFNFFYNFGGDNAEAQPEKNNRGIFLLMCYFCFIQF